MIWKSSSEDWGVIVYEVDAQLLDFKKEPEEAYGTIAA